MTTGERNSRLILLFLAVAVWTLSASLGGGAAVAAPSGAPIAETNPPATESASPVPPAEVTRLLAALQEHYRRLQDFQVNFLQRYRPGLLGTPREESGTLAVKMPGLMRWSYTQPERKEFIFDGRRFVFHEPQAKTATIYPAGALEGEKTPLLFLAGRGDLLQDFRVSPEPPGEPAPGRGVLVEILPREEDTSFQRAFLEISPGPPPLLLRLVVVDPLDNVTEYRFSNLRENAGLPAEMFRFRPPPGTQVFEERGAAEGRRPEREREN